MTSWDHPRKETPQEYRRRRAQIDQASAEADARAEQREREREERRHMVDKVGSSPYQRQLMMERKAQQDKRRNEPFAPNSQSGRADDEDKLPFIAANYFIAGVPPPPSPSKNEDDYSNP